MRGRPAKARAGAGAAAARPRARAGEPPAPATARPHEAPAGDRVLGADDASLLDLVDSLLNQGVVVNGEVILGLAGIDLVYLRLSALLCAADRVLPVGPTTGDEAIGARRRRSSRPPLGRGPR